MKMKEKIVGATSILVLSLIFLISGYFIDKRDLEVEKQIFTDTGKESLFIEDNNKKDKASESVKVSKEDETSENSSNEEKYIIVDIKGAVLRPKEYKLLEGSRVRDLIQAAGGITQEADENTIRFSKVLSDEECIVVYKKGELESSDLTNSIEVVEKPKDSKININKATLEELSTLYGIGEVKAKAIIEYREKNGGFKSIDDLDKVDGIGSKTVDKLRDKVDIK